MPKYMTKSQEQMPGWTPKQLALPFVFSQAMRSAIRGPSRKTLGKSMRSSVELIAASHRPGNFHLVGHQYGGALWRRIIDQGVRFGPVNPQLGSEIGRLAFHGQITAVEAEAASDCRRRLRQMSAAWA